MLYDNFVFGRGEVTPVYLCPYFILRSTIYCTSIAFLFGNDESSSSSASLLLVFSSQLPFTPSSSSSYLTSPDIWGPPRRSAVADYHRTRFSTCEPHQALSGEVHHQPSRWGLSRRVTNTLAAWGRRWIAGEFTRGASTSGCTSLCTLPITSHRVLDFFDH